MCSRKFGAQRRRPGRAAPAAAPRSGAAAQRIPSLLVFRTATAAEELHIVGYHVHLAPLGAVLGLPGPILQPTLDQDGVALLLVVGHCLAELAPRTDVEEVHLLVPGPDPVDRQPEGADGYAVVGEAHFRISREVAGEDHAVEVNHGYLP